MEEIDYSCEKCNGKSATVLHKFSKLPRYSHTRATGSAAASRSFHLLRFNHDRYFL